MATLILGLARDDDLGGDVDIGPGSLTGELDAIGKSRGGGVGPAGTAVLGNVLVADVGEIAGAVHVVPQDLLGEVSHGLEGSVHTRGGAVEVANAAGGLVGDLAVGKSRDAKKASDSEFHLKRVYLLLNSPIWSKILNISM